MSEQKRSRTGTRRTTMAVLGILKTSTNLGNPISIAQLVKRLSTEYGIDTSRDSVKDILDDLLAYYPGPDRIQCKHSDKDRPYQFDYYYQTELSQALQENIQRIEQVIRKNRNRQAPQWRLAFQFNGYGADQRLHPTSRIEEVLPVRLLWGYGHLYLVGFFAQRWDAAHFRVDLMSDIRAIEGPRATDEQWDFRISQISAEDYRSAHLYMFYERSGERPERIRLRIKKIPGKPNASLTFLQDNFGVHWAPVGGTETDEGLEIWVKCLPGTIVQFVRQYMDRVRVLEPESVVQEVETALRKDYQSYFQAENF